VLSCSSFSSSVEISRLTPLTLLLQQQSWASRNHSAGQQQQGSSSSGSSGGSSSSGRSYSGSSIRMPTLLKRLLLLHARQLEGRLANSLYALGRMLCRDKTLVGLLLPGLQQPGVLAGLNPRSWPMWSGV